MRLRDTLDQNLAIKTIKVIGSSHPVEWDLRGAGAVGFNFKNINLPPQSEDELGSMGFVQFSLDAKKSLLNGDKIDNTAAIFFDYNAPIITNTVTTEVSGIVKIAEATDIFPMKILSILTSYGSPSIGRAINYWNIRFLESNGILSARSKLLGRPQNPSMSRVSQQAASSYFAGAMGKFGSVGL